jgi:acetolactate decarboxylase
VILYQNIAAYHPIVDRRYQWRNRGDMRALLDLGNFGCGGAEKLSHELVVLDGIVYGIDRDGKVFRPDAAKECSFTTVTQFEAKESFDVSSIISFEQFLELLLQKVPQRTNPYAVKCEGMFRAVKGRTLFAHENGQEYVEDNLPKVDYVQIEGTIVGFIFPEYMNQILAGHQFHMHFIDKTKSVGCHVFRFDAERLTVEIMPIEKMVLNFDQF